MLQFLSRVLYEDTDIKISGMVGIVDYEIGHKSLNGKDFMRVKNHKYKQ